MLVASARSGPTPYLAAAARNPAPKQLTPEDDAFYLALTYFRETNVEALRIRQRLVDANAAALSTTPVSGRPIFADAFAVIQSEIAEAAQRAQDVKQIQQLDMATIAWCSREAAKVENAWDDLKRFWDGSDTAAEPLPSLQDRAQRSIRTLEDLSLACARITIPNELNGYLDNVRIGKSLDFVATFGDQLPSDDLTRSVLATLAPQSGVVSGLIDLKNSCVIKASPYLWRQLLSLLLIAVTVGIGFGLAALATHADTWLGFKTGGWPVSNKNWTTLNGAYLLVLVGVVGHWILDRVKQNQSGADLAPLSEWLLWLHVNEVPIIVRISTIWLILALGIAFKTFNLDDGVQPVTYFTAGYFLDSTFDALIGRFNTFISTKDPAQKSAAPAA